ncbi:fumarylacetoacetate hydrolase family protein [bacterium]|nr:fumarylacetoacetate hydrolase family protein [bacterium]
MKLFSFDRDGEVNIGVELENGRFNLTEAFAIYQHAKRINPPVSFAFLQVMVEMGYCSGQVVENIFADSWVKSKLHTIRLPAEVKFDLPILRPSKIVAIGRNYQAHVKELNHKMPTEPIFFCKATSSLIPHEGDIQIPAWLETRVDHEAELGLVIGKSARNVSESNAMDHVAGYTIVNDVTARAMQKEDIDAGNPWFRSKSLDTFCPVGPYLVPSDVVTNYQNLDIKLTVNGEVRQNDNTKNMIFPIPRLVSEVSKYMTLNPGDIIATGTPEGVGPIEDGDEIEISITGVGTLINRVKQL